MGLAIKRVAGRRHGSPRIMEYPEVSMPKKKSPPQNCRCGCSTTRAEPKKKKSTLSPRDRKTKASLIGLADGVVRAASGGSDPHVDIPSRTLSNVRYSPRKRIIEMGKNTNRRQLFNLSQAKAYMQTMLVASGCKKLIDEGKTTSIRGLFYMLKHTIEGTKEETFEHPKRMRSDHRRYRGPARQPPRGIAPVRQTNGANGRPHHGDRSAATRSTVRGWARAGTAIPSIVEPEVIKFDRA